MTSTNTPDPTPDSAELNKKTSVDASLHSLRLNTPILPQVRQLLLDLLSEYQSLDKPANPELLKLHIEAYEDKILALFKQYAQPPVVADEELDEILDEWLVHDLECQSNLTDDIKNCTCIAKDLKRNLKAALLQREQRLVAEARIDELEHAQKENRPAGGLHGPSHYAIDPDYAEKRLFQLRHNTNTGKEEEKS